MFCNKVSVQFFPKFSINTKKYIFLEREHGHRTQNYYYYSKKSPLFFIQAVKRFGNSRQLHSRFPAVFLSTHTEERILVLPDLCAFLHRQNTLILPIWNCREIKIWRIRGPFLRRYDVRKILSAPLN